MRTFHEQWLAIEARIKRIILQAGMTFGPMPPSDCYLHWNGSSTLVMLSNKVDAVVQLGDSIVAALSEMETLSHLDLLDFEADANGQIRLYFITLAGVERAPNLRLPNQSAPNKE